MPDLPAQTPEPGFDHPNPPEPVLLLPGWPGYRTQPGRSGLDYIDTQIELAHMTGIMLRKFFSGAWLQPGSGPHPILLLLVGIALLLTFPAYSCLGVLIVLVIGSVINFQFGPQPASQDEHESEESDPEAADDWSEDDEAGEEDS